MKSEYEFSFTTTGFRFEKDHSYTGTATNYPQLPNGLTAPKELRIDFKIVRDKEISTSDQNVAQSGIFYVTIPFRHEGMEEFVYGMVQTFQRQIHFNSPGKFDVYLACYLGREIPENEQEAEELGDRPNFGSLKLIEDIGEPVFDSSSFVANSGNLDSTYLDLFNHAFRAANPIDKYMSYFKILEDYVSCKKKVSVRKLLIENSFVRDLFTDISQQHEIERSYEEFIDLIVETRHECAHLKRSSNFGFQSGDVRLKEVVDEHIPLLEALTYRLTLKAGKITHNN